MKNLLKIVTHCLENKKSTHFTCPAMVFTRGESSHSFTSRKKACNSLTPSFLWDSHTAFLFLNFQRDGIINYDAFAKLLAHLSVFCLVEPQLAQTRTQVAMKRWSLLSPCFLWMFNTSVESLSNADQTRKKREAADLICHRLNYLPPISLALAVYRRDYFAMLIWFYRNWLTGRKTAR